MTPSGPFDYYLGVPEPSWLNRPDGVPKFVSAARFARYRTGGDRWPVGAQVRYAIDSGAYIALDGGNEDVPWFRDDDTYGGMVARFADNSGYPPDFCAPRDMPCEPTVRAKTGLTVREHQELTLGSYLWLVQEFPWIEWIPVLQGWEPGEHRTHAHMYEDAGVDLAGAHRVGIGSICRRGHLPEIVEVIEQFAESGYRMHGFGIKTTALPVIGHLLASADSMAWSFDARYTPVRLPKCTHAGPDCRNCYEYAKTWREQVLASLSEGKAAMPATKTPRPRRRPKAAVELDLLTGLEEMFSAAEQAGTVALTEVQIGQYAEVVGARAVWQGARNGNLYVENPKEKVPARGYVVHRMTWKGGVKLGKADMKWESPAAALVALADNPDVDWLVNAPQVRLVYLPLGARAELVDEPDEPVRTDGPAKAWMTDSLVHRAEAVLATVHPGENVTWAAAVVAAAEAWEIASVLDGYSGLPCSGGGRTIKGWQRPLGYVERHLMVSPKAEVVQVLTEKGGEVLAQVTAGEIRDLILDVTHFAPQSTERLLTATQALEQAIKDDEAAQRRNGGAAGAQRETYARLRLASDACYEAADQFWQDAETMMAARIAGGDVPVVDEPIAAVAEEPTPEPVDVSLVDLDEVEPGDYIELTGFTFEMRPWTWRGYVGDTDAKWSCAKPGMRVVSFHSTWPKREPHGDIHAVQVEPGTLARRVQPPALRPFPEPAAPAAALLDLDAVAEAVDAEMLQLELDLGDLFGGTTPAAEPVRDVLAEAREILTGFEPGVTPLGLAQWAAGVVTLRHPMYLVRWWEDPDVPSLNITNGDHCAAGVSWTVDSKKFRLAEPGSGDVTVQRPVFETTWFAPMRMVDEEDVPAELVARARAAMKERRDATIPYDPTGARQKTDPEGYAAVRARWSAAEAEAYAAGLAVWTAVKPS